jgi:hypothetical protein
MLNIGATGITFELVAVLKIDQGKIIIDNYSTHYLSYKLNHYKNI